jgi:hypothetical protein
MHTTTQPNLFSLSQSLANKDAGIAQAAANKASLLKYAKRLAVDLAREKGVITADDVAFELHRKGISIHALGNAAGALFKGGDWQFTGEFVRSTRSHANGNLLRVWRLKKYV